jgi:hypothetical protein
MYALTVAHLKQVAVARPITTLCVVATVPALTVRTGQVLAGVDLLPGKLAELVLLTSLATLVTSWIGGRSPVRELFGGLTKWRIGAGRWALVLGAMPILAVAATSPDPQTWKDMAWLGVTSIVGVAAEFLVITAAGLVATYVSMPLWYWAASQPHNGHGVTAFDFLTVDTLGEAGIAAVVGLLLLPFVLLLARWCAATHAALAVRMLATDGTP